MDNNNNNTIYNTLFSRILLENYYLKYIFKEQTKTKSVGDSWKSNTGSQKTKKKEKYKMAVKGHFSKTAVDKR